MDIKITASNVNKACRKLQKEGKAVRAEGIAEILRVHPGAIYRAYKQRPEEFKDCIWQARTFRMDKPKSKVKEPNLIDRALKLGLNLDQIELLLKNSK